MDFVTRDIGKQLMILLWYLSGWAGDDYSQTTRRDMLEGAMQSLGGYFNDHPDLITDLVQTTIDSYSDHPNQEKVKEFMSTLCSSLSGGDSEINATNLVK